LAGFALAVLDRHTPQPVGIYAIGEKAAVDSINPISIDRGQSVERGQLDYQFAIRYESGADQTATTTDGASHLGSCPLDVARAP
jgi:hypothetical protein